MCRPVTPTVRCVGFVAVRACPSWLSRETLFLLVVGPWLELATDTMVVLRDLAAVMGRYIPSWLTAPKTAHVTRGCENWCTRGSSPPSAAR